MFKLLQQFDEESQTTWCLDLQHFIFLVMKELLV